MYDDDFQTSEEKFLAEAKKLAEESLRPGALPEKGPEPTCSCLYAKYWKTYESMYLQQVAHNKWLFETSMRRSSIKRRQPIQALEIAWLLMAGAVMGAVAALVFAV